MLCSSASATILCIKSRSDFFCAQAGIPILPIVEICFVRLILLNRFLADPYELRSIRPRLNCGLVVVRAFAAASPTSPEESSFSL